MQKTFIIPKSRYNTMQLLLNYQLKENEKLVFRVKNALDARFKFDYVKFKDVLILWIKRIDYKLGWKVNLIVKFYSLLHKDNFKYDIIYRWVNPNVFNNVTTLNNDLALPKESLKNPQRYRDNGELKYSIRSVIKFCKKNLGKIYIIARGRPPLWLKPDHKKIIWIEEDVLFKKIEQFWKIKITVKHSEICKLAIQWIPYLNEHFVLMDDDFFIMKEPVFFTANGYPICKYNELVIDHHPLPFTKKIYIENIKKLSLKYVRLIIQTKVRKCADPFRLFKIKGRIRMNYIYSPSGINTHKQLYPYNFNQKGPYGYPPPFSKAGSKYDIVVTWSWIPRRIVRNTRPILEREFTYDDISNFFKSIDSFDPTFLCINDDWDYNNAKKYQKYIEVFHNFISKKFPTPTIWEI